MRHISHEDAEFNTLKHLVMCLPYSGATYLGRCLALEGRSVGHETLNWSQGMDQIGVRPDVSVPEIYIDHYMFRYKIHEKLDKRLWVLVRDPLDVAASLMYMCGCPFNKALDRITNFYMGMEKFNVEGHIHVDLPCRWMGFDSTKDYGVSRQINGHNKNVISLNMEAIISHPHKSDQMSRFIETRSTLGY